MIPFQISESMLWLVDLVSSLIICPTASSICFAYSNHSLSSFIFVAISVAYVLFVVKGLHLVIWTFNVFLTRKMLFIFLLQRMGLENNNKGLC
mmetsp:Transcript_21603/g.33000  ORF Transcript_21603/g.33000 Transcript_21603/m.33000 type:complete len:93 (-) Transcript_21603:183-461(-)